MPSADHAQFECDSMGETGYLSTTFGCVPPCLAVAVWRNHDTLQRVSSRRPPPPSVLQDGEAHGWPIELRPADRIFLLRRAAPSAVELALIHGHADDTSPLASAVVASRLFVADERRRHRHVRFCQLGVRPQSASFDARGDTCAGTADFKVRDRK